MQPVAYSYIRFSSLMQEYGDSVRRQLEAAVDWARRNDVPLDRSLKIDRGISALKGRNVDEGSLGEFLRMVAEGIVRPGDYLIVENLDRATRMAPVPALTLLTGLLSAGVRLVQLTPTEKVYDRESGPWDIMMMVMELTRGHGESVRKVGTVGGAWREKREQARAGKALLTTKLPAWCHVVDGRAEVIPDRAEVLRLIFDWAGEGVGAKGICRRLNDAQVPTWGRSKEWSTGYVNLILTDRRVLGFFQMRSRGVPDGTPIEAYPVVIDAALYDRVQAGRAQRRRTKSKERGDHVNVFSGLLWNARVPDDSYVMTASGKSGVRVVVSGAALNGRGAKLSVQYDVLERAVLAGLDEVRAADVFGQDEDLDERRRVQDERDAVAADLALLTERLARKVTTSLMDQAEQREEALERLDNRLKELRVREAHPAGRALGEAQGLWRTMAEQADQHAARLRLRAALARVVESIHLCVVPRGWGRFCVAQVTFAEAGRCRRYLIYHSPPKGNRKGGRGEGYAVSYDLAVALGADAFDLRREDDVAELVRQLEALPLDQFRQEG